MADQASRSVLDSLAMLARGSHIHLTLESGEAYGATVSKTNITLPGEDREYGVVDYAFWVDTAHVEDGDLPDDDLAVHAEWTDEQPAEFELTVLDPTDDDPENRRALGTLDRVERVETDGGRVAADDHGESITAADIAADQMAYLRENPGVCADVSIHAGNHPWVRYHDGEWQYAKFGDYGRIEGKVLDAETVQRLFAGNPVTLEPVSEAYQWRAADRTVWEHAAEQDVFTDFDRCFWCGHSERTRDLTEYETTEDGDCLLCEDCYESFDKHDQIVGATADDQAEMPA